MSYLTILEAEFLFPSAILFRFFPHLFLYLCISRDKYLVIFNVAIATPCDPKCIPSSRPYATTEEEPPSNIDM